MSAKPFWQTKTLKQMSKQEWESLCDGCARCCLHKLEDEDTDEVYYTDIHCRYLDKGDCSCTVYETRNVKVPECIWLTPEQAESFHWLPDTCAYRLIAEGKSLYDWHPLVSGDPNTVHTSEISLQGKGVPDDKVPEEEWQSHIIWKA